jgi:hypothetical protein
MMLMALFSCPKCAWRVKFTDKDLGKKTKCIQCAHEFVFPAELTKDKVAPVAEKPAPAKTSAASQSQPRESSGLKWIVLTVAVLVVGGCLAMVGILLLGGGKKAIVAGTVTYNDQPLAGGSISLLGENGYGQASIGKDGTFLITDAPLGSVKASVRHVTSFMKKLKGDKIKWEQKSIIPRKYSDPELSGLNYTISAGRQEIRVHLTD